MKKKYIGLYVKYYCQILKTFQFSRHIFRKKKPQKNKFQEKIRQVEAKLFHVYGRTDTQTWRS